MPVSYTHLTFLFLSIKTGMPHRMKVLLNIPPLVSVSLHTTTISPNLYPFSLTNVKMKAAALSASEYMLEASVNVSGEIPALSRKRHPSVLPLSRSPGAALSSAHFRFPGLSLSPVSYTHLDVYKRQISRFLRSGTIGEIDAVLFLGQTSAVGRVILFRIHITDIRRFLMILGIRSVSFGTFTVEGDLLAVVHRYHSPLQVCPEDFRSQVIEPAQRLLMGMTIHIVFSTRYHHISGIHLPEEIITV